jgi:hypothetical protein
VIGLFRLALSKANGNDLVLIARVRKQFYVTLQLTCPP